MYAMIWRARARARASTGNSGAQSGGGKVSSRYSTIASDSVSQNSPCCSAGTRAIAVALRSAAGTPPSRSSARAVANSSCFSVSATKQVASHVLVKYPST